MQTPEPCWVRYPTLPSTSQGQDCTRRLPGCLALSLRRGAGRCLSGGRGREGGDPYAGDGHARRGDEPARCGHARRRLGERPRPPLPRFALVTPGRSAPPPRASVKLHPFAAGPLGLVFFLRERPADAKSSLASSGTLFTNPFIAPTPLWPVALCFPDGLPSSSLLH